MCAAPLTSVDELRAELGRLLGKHTDRREEARLLALLRGASAGALDSLLARIDLAALVAAVDDRLIGPDNRAALLSLLCVERLDDLSVPVRAALVTALQRGRTGSADEEAIARIFLGTRGAALSALKNAIDAGDDHRDLLQLVHHDIDDQAVRDRILDHIASEALSRGELKVLSDIDDTLYSNWKDTRYPKTNPATGKRYTYPGVRAFYRELDLVNAAEPVLCDLTFLTARPGDRVGMGEGVTRGHLTELLLGYAKILTGDFSHLLTHELMAERKYQSFVAYRRLFPEYDFVFCGDSGQGDAIAGGLMMKHPGGSVRAVFIHDVVNTDEPARAEWRARGVHFHDTYVGAAYNAHKLGLLDAPALSRVAEEAVRELGAIGFETEAQRAGRITDFRRDLDRVNAVLPEKAWVRMPG